MARPIRCASPFPVPAQRVYETLVDRAYLESRLAEMGGRNAELLELTADPESASYLLRQGVGRDQLPGMLKNLFTGDLMIERRETWRRTAPGRYQGTVHAAVRDTPGEVNGELVLADTPTGSEYALTGTATVKVPLIGGKVESLIVDHIARLVASETRFTQQWLSG